MNALYEPVPLAGVLPTTTYEKWVAASEKLSPVVPESIKKYAGVEKLPGTVVLVVPRGPE
jgi:hypothetical protein